MIPQALGNMAGAALVIALPYKLIALLLASVLALTTAYIASRPALQRSRRDSARLTISTDRPDA
jgi:uncharacterized membrane protein YfcA